MPDASLLSEILLQKYEYHMPFYRQIKQMAHLGMTGLKEATMVGWYKRTMELLRPLYDVLVAEVFRSHYVQTDESTVPVINNDRHQADKEYLWMSRAVMERLVVFFYSDGSRAGDVIKVAHIGYDPRSGNYIKLRHGNFTVSYCHLIRKPNIPIGSKVFPGQPVAHVGSTGRSTGPHLHITLKRNGRVIDPAILINAKLFLIR